MARIGGKVVVAIGALVLAAACAREPEPGACPDAGEGDLVVTELSAGVVDGEWIELHNASDRDISLFGLRVQMTPTNGAEADVVLVRREDVVVAAGEYVVLGNRPDSALPDHLDYGFRGDMSRETLRSSAELEVAACGETVDVVVYFGLEGTRSLDGASPPNAEANDADEGWCLVDDSGTPGEANPPCA